MIRNGLLLYFFLTVLLLHPLIVLSVNSQIENNTPELRKKLTDDIIKDPSGNDALYCAAELLNIAPFTGREKIISSFSDALKKLEESGDKESINPQVLRLLSDELEGNYIRSIRNFSVIRKWNVSGSWTRYGLPSRHYGFQPEKAVSMESIHKGAAFSTDESGEIFPFKTYHLKGDTAYLTCSFTCDEGIILWIISDSKYRLFINGRELPENEISGEREIKACSLKGAKGYTVQIKITAENENHHPCLRAMITDVKNSPVKISYSGMIFNYPYTPEKLFSLKESAVKVSCEASVLTDRMNQLIESGDFYGAYKLGSFLIEKYPSYAPVYGRYMHLLDIMNRNDEFHRTLKDFRKIFPDSDIHFSWLAEFYMTRDRTEFARIMKEIRLWSGSRKIFESYIYLLCGEKKYAAAAALCLSLKQYPEMKTFIPHIIKESGDMEAWRKILFTGITCRDEVLYYYDLGLAEMLIGIDPVMYWKKGFSMEKNSGLLRDLSGIYENSILAPNDFYKGIYTDYHPEFLHYSKKRKISVYISGSGKIFFEGEDIIPSVRKILKTEYSGSGLEFSGGQISASLPFISGMKILYVLSAADGLPSVINYTKEYSSGRGLSVKYKVTGKEEFSVIKYSGEITSGKKNIFMLAEGLMLKQENEKISELDFEVIIYGDYTPAVNYKNSPLLPVKSDNGIIKFFLNEKFTDDGKESVIADIFRFSSDADFSEWYAGIISGMSRYKNIKLTVPGKSITKDYIKEVHLQVMTGISKTGMINFDPDKPDSVLLKGRGTVEERVFVAKSILENSGIKSFISFLKNKNGLPEKILLYIPEKKERGYWLDFYGEYLSDNSGIENEAIIITSEGYKKAFVNRDAYIR